MNTAAPEIIPTVIGTPFAGGIYAGRFFIADKPYALVVAPKHDGEFPATIWNESPKKVAGALSVYDGLANTEAMVAAGSALARKIRDLRLDGADDWYMPSRGELLLAHAAGLEGADAFDKDWYWSSTQYASGSVYAWIQSFSYGYQYYTWKANRYLARAVRRVPI